MATSAMRKVLIDGALKDVLDNQRVAFTDTQLMEKELRKEYKKAKDKIMVEVNNLASSVSSWDIGEAHKYSRLQNLMTQIDKHIKDLGGNEVAYVNSGLQSMYVDQYLREAYSLGQKMNINFSYDKIDPLLVKEAINYPWSGAMFSDRIWDNKDGLVKSLREHLTQSLILGESLRAVADRIEADFGKGLANSIRLARTEGMRVSYVAKRKAMEDNNVKKVRYYATTSDERTCGECKGYHKKEYVLGKEPSLPRHPHCRCTYSGVISRLEDNELNEVTQAMRDSGNYNAWRRGQGIKISQGVATITGADLRFSGEEGKKIAFKFQEDYNQKTIKRYSWEQQNAERRLAEFEQMRKDGFVFSNEKHIQKVEEKYRDMLKYFNGEYTDEIIEVAEKATTSKIEWTVPGDNRIWYREVDYRDIYHYEEKDGGKYFINYVNSTTKKEQKEIEDTISGFIKKNKRSTGIKVQIDNKELNDRSKGRGGIVLGYFRSADDKIVMRNFKGYEDIYKKKWGQITSGKKNFITTMSHELAHRSHSSNPFHSGIVLSSKEWDEWEKLIEPYYEQYRVNKVVDIGKEWHRFDYPVNAEDNYRGGGKFHFYQEMFAESSSVMHTEDILDGNKGIIYNAEDEKRNLAKYFPKVDKFIEGIYK